MKRKIAAIFAADIAGYSRLVAEDEEETLRRLASYRQVTDDFIAKCGGRIFNTAGDAVLAEFPSAVEAVRCAIDIQESLRTRNMAYPPSRQMSFRIGITIGDVVERDGDLLGEGVNIAARLEGLAEVGGICVSRAVHEQVANKLSVQFADIGAQEVKNIPTPVHAFMVAMRREDGSYSTPQVKKPIKASDHGAPNWMWPVAVTLISLAAIGVGGFLYFTKLENMAAKQAPQVASSHVSPAPAPSMAPTGSPSPTFAPPPVGVATPISPPTPAPTPTVVASAVPAPPPPSPIASGEAFAAAAVPFIGDRIRATLDKEYAPATDFKAFSLNFGGFNAFVTGQPSEEAARSMAVEQCQKRADSASSPRKCELYAVGNRVVYVNGKPPMPPPPWIKHDPVTERSFSSREMPLTREPGKARIENIYVPARKTKILAVGPGVGQYYMVVGVDSVEEAARRSLESCGAIAGVPCMIVALNDAFVAPVPTTMRVTGFFKAADTSLIAPEARDDAARKLADAASGWSAVAVGAARRPGLGLKQASEQAAVNEALSECAKRDSDCRIVAVGPFTVGPN
ncbi:adenylate/guanylate cyclase domain-containing protein [Bradyrhizobium sp. AUGA SZCCT0222]|uniref:adenylate/guanylate cyclase domain-containing protein n=1 Tax=Bradyrhizobium sp. AUGA SZCCT0222 TaxID=2807668 RepID=UPI001BAE13CA|nr:adenylate/guanylate cyclase domain-containing protein [Bradyrhizobium sp. AUGA SZCCT0222]MBR1269149.1 adenylate/guanylate cyclase domain-containing protein [Bradyrhizobium sp. AUGA SZCCT0222]